MGNQTNEPLIDAQGRKRSTKSSLLSKTLTILLHEILVKKKFIFSCQKQNPNSIDVNSTKFKLIRISTYFKQKKNRRKEDTRYANVSIRFHHSISLYSLLKISCRNDFYLKMQLEISKYTSGINHANRFAETRISLRPNL